MYIADATAVVRVKSFSSELNQNQLIGYLNEMGELCELEQAKRTKRPEKLDKQIYLFEASKEDASHFCQISYLK